MLINNKNSLRALLASDNCHLCASLYDPLSARMAKSIGYRIGILGGSVSSLLQLGAPDISLLTLSELTDHAKRICQGAELPIIADGDSGYGNAMNTMRMVRELEMAGVAGITIEDTRLPKPFNDSGQLASITEVAGKLEAALVARKNPETLIIARTPADSSQPLPSILERIDSYTRCGVDALCVFGVTRLDRLAAIREVTSLPLMVISYDCSALGTLSELTAHGVRILMRGHMPFEAAVGAAYQALLSNYQNRELTNNSKTGRKLISEFCQRQHLQKAAATYEL